MRLAYLYAKSRQLPAATAGSVLATVAAWLFSALINGNGIKAATLALVVGATVFGPSLTGQDVHLDRTVAVRWVPRRTLHLLLAGAVVTGVMLSWNALHDGVATDESVMDGVVTPALLLRDCIGAVGLVALTAVFFGSQFAWTVPLVWFTAALFVPPSYDTAFQVTAWMLQPEGTSAATWTAAVLGVTGTVAYAVFGNRR